MPSTGVRSVKNNLRELTRHVDPKIRPSAELTVPENKDEQVTKSTRDLSNVSNILGKSSKQKKNEPLERSNLDSTNGASTISEKPSKRKKTELQRKIRDLSGEWRSANP
jgi:hypothetical protein